MDGRIPYGGGHLQHHADREEDAQGKIDGQLLREAYAHLLGQRELPLPRLRLVSLSCVILLLCGVLES